MSWGTFKMKAGWIALGLIAAASLASAQAPAPDRVVHIGIARSLATAATYYAADKGYFHDVGVKADLEELDSSSNAMSLLAQGQLDIVEGGVAVGFFNALDRGLPLAIANDRVSTPLGHKLILRKDLVGAVKTVADLKGRIIATNAVGAVTTYEIAQILAKGGLSIKDVDLKAMSFVNMGVALTNGAVDAALVIPPWVQQYVESGLGIAFADPDEAATVKPLTIAVSIINTDWAAKNRDFLRGYYVAYQRGVYAYCQAYHGGPERAAMKELMMRSGIETRETVIDRYPWPARNANGHPNIPSILDMQKYYLHEGLASKEQPVSKIFDTSFVDYATSKLGPFVVENKASTLEGCR